MVQRYKKILVSFACFFFSLLLVVGAFAPPSIVFADITSIDISNTSIVSDLADCDLSGYKADPNGNLSIYSFTEYGFDTENYGIYLYLYNPTCKAYKNDTTLSKINMSIDFKTDSKGNVVPNSFNTYSLVIIDKTIDNLFYKIKIVIDDTFKSKVKSNNNNFSERRYDITSIHFCPINSTVVKDNSIGLIYTCQNVGNDLVCLCREYDYKVEFDTVGTYYRVANTFDEYTDINTVYFAVDNELINKYGYISSIFAEYYRYTTQPIVVTSNKTYFNELCKYIGYHDSFINDCKFSLYHDYPDSRVGNYYDWSFNPANSGTDWKPVFDDYRSRNYSLPYLFYTGGVNVNDYIVTKFELEDYIKNYTESYNGGTVYGGYSADLFTADSVGYDTVEVNGKDTFSLDGFDLGTPFRNWWNKSLVERFPTINNIKPIEFVTSQNYGGISPDNVYIQAGSEFDSFKDFTRRTILKNMSVCVFRFATSNYVVRDIVVGNSSGSTWGYYDDVAEYRQCDVFLGFKVISCTFTDSAEVSTVIGVVNSPIDIIPDLTPQITPDGIDWLLILYLGIGLLGAFFVVAFISSLTSKLR